MYEHAARATSEYVDANMSRVRVLQSGTGAQGTVNTSHTSTCLEEVCGSEPRAQPRLANGCLGLRIYLSPEPENQPKFQIPVFYTALVREFWLADRFATVF
jgi:hypothetical protein